MFNITDLLTYIVMRSCELGTPVTKTQLIKYLYLFDLFWSQENQGQTYTNLKWQFLHYGPYASECEGIIENAFKSNQILTVNNTSNKGHDYTIYKVEKNSFFFEDEKFKDKLPIHVLSNLDSSLSKWNGDLSGLLDFVYFKTGPMKDVTKGDYLDFTLERKIKIQDIKPIKLIPLNEDKKLKARVLIQKLKESLKIEQNISSSMYDINYYQFINSMSEESLPAEISGNAVIQQESTKNS